MKLNSTKYDSHEDKINSYIDDNIQLIFCFILNIVERGIKNFDISHHIV